MAAQPEKVIIIGSGPAGLTAAIYTARANLQPVVIEGTKPGGQLMGTSFVENWPGYEKILGPELMQNMRNHALSLGTRFIEGDAKELSLTHRPFTVHVHPSKVFTAQAIILALGATPKRLACAGEELYWGKGVTTCAICDGALYRNKKVIVVGGGDSAMEEASFLHKFTDQITIVHVLDTFTASHAMQQRVQAIDSINTIYSSTITEIKGDGSRITHATITNQKTGTTTTLEVDGIFVAIGLSPNTAIVKNNLELDKWGYIKLSEGTTNTSVEGVFAAGDVHDYRYRQAITSAGSGCMAALDAERYLSSQPNQKHI